MDSDGLTPKHRSLTLATLRPQDFGSNVGVGNSAADTAAFDAMFDAVAPGDTIQLDTVPSRGTDLVDKGYLIDMGSLASAVPSGKVIWRIPSDVTIKGTVDANGNPAMNAGIVIVGSHMAARGFFLLHNADQTNGNDNITIRDLYVEGRKYQADRVGGDGAKVWSIDDVLHFVRIKCDIDHTNHNIKFLNNNVQNWLGIVYDQHYTDGFDVSDNVMFAAHRGSLIFRFYNRNGSINRNNLTKCGDDGIALNSQETGDVEGPTNTNEAANIVMYNNVVGEKRKQDIKQPVDDRARGGNSPIHIVGGRNITIGAGSDTRNQIVSMFDGDNGPLGQVNTNTVNNPTSKNGRDGERQPAVDIETRDGDGLVLRDINIRWLRIVPTDGASDTSNKCKGLRVLRTGTTGHLGDGYYPTYDAAGCAWQITPDAPNWTLGSNNPSCRR